MEVLAALARKDGLDGDLAVPCALGHGLIEDTGIACEAIVAACGPAVADGVLALSRNDRKGGQGGWHCINRYPL